MAPEGRSGARRASRPGGAEGRWPRLARRRLTRSDWSRSGYRANCVRSRWVAKRQGVAVRVARALEGRIEPALLATVESRRLSMEWIVHGERRVYENGWVNLDLVDVELPDGQRFEHHVLRMQRVAAAVVLDGAGKVLLLWRHRFIAGTWGWEIPMGIVEPGESSVDTAAREVEEETGWRPTGLLPLVSYQPCIGIADTPHDLFVATGAERVGQPTEVTEAEHVDWVALAEIPALIDQGDIRDAATLVGLLRVMLAQDLYPPEG